MRPSARRALILAGAVAALGATGSPSGAETARYTPMSCTALDPDTVRMRPGNAAPGARGVVDFTMPPSPYGVTVSEDGRYVYDVTVRVERLRRRADRRYVAWATTPELDRVRRLGVLGPEGIASGRVTWNKFLVLVTEEAGGFDGQRWEGPVMLTATSPSGLMHTMRGHGIFEAHGIGC